MPFLKQTYTLNTTIRASKPPTHPPYHSFCCSSYHPARVHVCTLAPVSTTLPDTKINKTTLGSSIRYTKPGNNSGSYWCNTPPPSATKDKQFEIHNITDATFQPTTTMRVLLSVPLNKSNVHCNRPHDHSPTLRDEWQSPHQSTPPRFESENW
jgi:hypothetical protein